MRAVILGLASLTIAGNAMAADYLRGSTFDEPPAAPGYDWSGTYVGGHIGWANTTYGFSDSTQPLVADILRQTLVENEAHFSKLPNLPRGGTNGMVYGGFIGYNSQWGDAVFGAELNYSHYDGDTVISTDTIGRSFQTSNEYLNNVLIDSVGSARLTDLGTLRMRVGYAFGWLMPYGMVGVAMGRADAFRSAHVRLVSTDASASALDPTDGIPPRPTTGIDETRTESKNGAITFGYMLGAGLDVGLMPGVFVRGEWELVQLNSVLSIPITVNTFRLGAAVKF